MKTLLILNMIHSIKEQLFRYRNWKYKTCIIFLIFSNNLIFSQSKSCNGTLEIEKNRASRSTTNKGTYYKLNLTNNSLTSDVYTLTALNSNVGCSNSFNQKITSNNDFNIEFLDLNFNLITNLFLNTNQTKPFLVHITIPSNSKNNKWCCTQISAESKNCNGYILKTNLQTLLIESIE